MEILNAILVLLMVSAFLVILWVLPIVLGLKLAKRNKISAYWMLFGIYPVMAWIGYAIVRLRGRIDQVGNAAVQWIPGKVACPSCGEFISMNKAYCTNCGMSVLKPVCPHCGKSKTYFARRVRNYIGWGILLFVFGGITVNVGQIGTQGATTWGDLLIALIAIPLFAGATVSFFMPLAKRTKRVKCSSCGRESPVTAVVAFQQPPGQETQPEPLKPV